MFKFIKNSVIGAVVAMAALAGSGGEAKAEQCREYTRTVNIGNRVQEAYGTACLQSDGSWMIVGEGLGNDIPVNASNVDYVIHDNNRYVTPQRVVYYDARPNYYRPRPSPVFVWNFGNDRYYRNGHYVNYNRGRDWNRYDNRRWDRHDRHDRDDHRGRGRGNGHR
jgi:hypothetical protein